MVYPDRAAATAAGGGTAAGKEAGTVAGTVEAPAGVWRQLTSLYAIAWAVLAVQAGVPLTVQFAVAPRDACCGTDDEYTPSKLRLSHKTTVRNQEPLP